MAGLCAVLMGVFALMTVLVLAGSGGKARLEGSLGYPDAGPLPDMVAPGSSPSSSAHVSTPHVTPSKSAAAGSLGRLAARALVRRRCPAPPPARATPLAPASGTVLPA